MNTELIRKYNVPGPRYTSYPTVPYWDQSPTIEEWKTLVKDSFDISNETEGISLYLHLPFCESLCTFCGCNKRITVNHAVETPYMEVLLKEWDLYLELLGSKPKIKELHLGGGTPTFFSPENLNKLIGSILSSAEIAPNHAFGFEAHPGNTTKEHLQVLFDLGFKRFSLGIQSFNPKVQKVINRIQTYDQIEECVTNAREIGYTSINFDFIYGLPFQTIDTIRDTIEKSNIFKPERIAYYSYAHVPWVSASQRAYSEEDLPSNEEKRALYELGKEMFEANGYIEIGMDHFALKTDDLAISFDNKTLHRNFMGYASEHTRLMIGLGVSSISDSWTGFGQNLKVVEEYKEAVLNGEFPIFRGHVLNEEDLILRQHILDIMCHFETTFDDSFNNLPEAKMIREKVQPMIDDQLMEWNENQLTVFEGGRAFVRNICMSFDLRLYRKKPDTALFSQTI